MADREDGGAHTGEVTEHAPFSLATSYFAQINNEPLINGDPLTAEQKAARTKKLNENYDKAME